jgi:hypothetical protein
VTEKELAEAAVVRAYEGLLDAAAARERFVEAVRKAHDLRVSDGCICKLIEYGYSRSRIQQFRTGKYRKDL